MSDKLTDPQRRVLLLMTQGWELRLDRYWTLQEGGAGRGGRTQDVRPNTVDALRTRLYIRAAKREFPNTIFEVTEAGRRALAAARSPLTDTERSGDGK